jgi:hypothetical protein
MIVLWGLNFFNGENYKKLVEKTNYINQKSN